MATKAKIVKLSFSHADPRYKRIQVPITWLDLIREHYGKEPEYVLVTPVDDTLVITPHFN